MKNYEEVAESVFKRSEEMIAQNKRRRRDRLINIVATVSCLAVAGAVGIGVWKTVGQSGAQVVSDIYLPQSGANAAASQFANDEQDNINEDYLIVDRYIPSNTSGVDSIGTESDAATSIESSVDTSTENSVDTSAESSAESIIFPAFEPSVNNSVSGMVGVTPDGYSGPMNFSTIIEEYGTVNTIPDSAPENGTMVGVTPDSGTYVFSDALKGAMEEYGYTDENGDVLYRVAVDFYSNGETVDVNLPAIREIEFQRLAGCGYQCHFETCGKEWGNIVEHHFCMMLTREQLENFPPCENYGCTFHLYGERHCILTDDDTSTSSDYILPAQNQGCHHGWGAGNGYGNGYGHHGGHC